MNRGPVTEAVRDTTRAFRTTEHLRPKPFSPGARQRKVAVAVVAVVVATCLGLPMVSLGKSLAAPGAAPWTARSVDWFRDHGGAPIVNGLEDWYYSSHTGASRPPALSQLPGISSARDAPAAPSGRARPDPWLPRLPARTPYPLPGEGRWQLDRVTGDGKAAMWTSYFRPERQYPGMLAAVAVLPRGRTVAHLVAGTLEPGGRRWPGNGSVPAAAVPDLTATFNAGWRFQDTRAGFEIGGHGQPSMINGLATAVITKSGQLDVRRWQPGNHRDVAAARQNLHLIVDGGVPATGLADNAAGLWGNSRNQLQYTARTGLGVDRYGNAIFIAGTHMNLQALARAFTEVGAQTAMELDIHPSMTFFARWAPNARHQNLPTKLLPTMQRRPDRYLEPDQRDFFYVTVRGSKLPR